MKYSRGISSSAVHCNAYLRVYIDTNYCSTVSAYFKPSQISWQLQHYHTPYNSPAIKDASFYIKRIIKVTVYTLQSRAYNVVSLGNKPKTVLHTKWPLHYQRCIFLQKEMNYDFWSASQYVSLLVELLQQFQCSVCTLSGLENFCILAIY